MNVKRIVIANLTVLLVLSTAGAQSRSDICHVYVVDVAKARKVAAHFFTSILDKTHAAGI